MLSFASIIKKTSMAVTGLLWFGFLVAHLVGNFLLFVGPEEFNGYAKKLESLGPLLYAAEIALIIFLVTHIYSGVKVSLENRQARPLGYEVQKPRTQYTVFSRSMAVGGILIALFIVTHVAAFKFGDHHGEGGLYGLVMQSFQKPLVVAWYVLAMVAIGMHLSHGLGSAFQTLGVARPIWRTRLRYAGLGIGWAVAAGFISLPVWAFMFGAA